MREKLLGVISCCLNHNDIFVVNENDCLSDNEIKFGDNDTLTGELAIAVSGLARSLHAVFLTNVNGLYRQADDESTVIRTVSMDKGECDIHDALLYTGEVTDSNSRGGMYSKVEATRKVTDSRTRGTAYIANGREAFAVTRALRGSIGTRFFEEYDG